MATASIFIATSNAFQQALSAVAASRFPSLTSASMRKAKRLRLTAEVTTASSRAHNSDVS